MREGLKSTKKDSLKGYEYTLKPESKDNYSQRYETQVKYKTEFCRNLQSGFCEFGEKCFFAHSQEELREKSYQTSLKTIKCRSFFELGYCINGTKCQYNHRDHSPETAENSPNNSKKASRKGSEDTHRRSVFIDLELRSLY